MKIIQYKNGIPIKKYNTICEIQKKKGYSKGHISECLNGKRDMAYGYTWKYQDFKSINDIFDLVVSIVLIVCLILFGISIIKDIMIMNELEYPEECVEINEDYYCKTIKSKSVKM